MKFSVLNRKVHYWLAIVVALPAAVMIGSGLLLQLKKQAAWVQPPEQRGAGQEPTVSFARMLEACRGVPEAGIQSWADVNRMDVRPSRGLIKVTAKSNWEVQLDARTGDVLQAAYRRSDVIESIHDGSWFHEGVKLGVFLPAGVILLVLWATGLYLFWLPIVVRRRRKRSPVGKGPPGVPAAG
jgi:uncharacterized iron-regulated membrane protein